MDTAPNLLEIGCARSARGCARFRAGCARIVGYARYGIFTGVHRILPIEAVRRQQVVRPFLLARDVAAIRGVHDLGQGHVPTDRSGPQPTSTARARRMSDLSAGALDACSTGTDERGAGCCGQRCPTMKAARTSAAAAARTTSRSRRAPGVPPGSVGFGQAMANPLPDLEPVLDRHVPEPRQRQSSRAFRRPAGRAPHIRDIAPGASRRPSPHGRRSRRSSAESTPLRCSASRLTPQ